MIQRVASFIKDQKLLLPDRIVLVALSGGPDSVALLHILHALHYPLQALHCNFHLRDAESDRDQHFVETLCNRMGIPLQVKHFPTQEYASGQGISIEMAARDLRYGWFREQACLLRAQAIAVGHHKDDQAETVLLNLLRGTGIRGMAGMHPRQGNVVRPLLCLSRNEIENYLLLHNLQSVTDSTNLHADVLRNRMRLQVMPLLRDMQPAVAETLSRAAQHILQALPYYEEGVRHAMSKAGFSGNTLHTEAYIRQGTPFILLHEWLAPLGFNATQTHDIHQHLQGQPGHFWDSPTHRLLRDRNLLLVRDRNAVPTPPEIEMAEVRRIGPTGPQYAYVDADSIRQPLTARLVGQGDWFVPFGMTGRKLVSDFLTNQKMSRFEKEAQWVLCAGDDIVWLIGQRADNRFRVTPETRHILQLKIKEPNNSKTDRQ